MPNAQEVVIGNKQLVCPFCENNRFIKHDVKMNKKLLSMFDMEFLSKSGQAYVCDNCGLKQEFYTR